MSHASFILNSSSRLGRNKNQFYLMGLLQKLAWSILLTSCALVFTACSDDDGDNERKIKIVKTTLTDAKYICSSSQEANLRSSGTKSNINDFEFGTISEDGKYLPIRFISETNDTLNFTIYNVLDLNEDYLLLCGDFLLEYTMQDDGSYYGDWIEILLMEKSTGEMEPLDMSISINNIDEFYTFSVGNSIYLKSHYGSGAASNKIYQITVKNIHNVNLKVYQTSDWFSEFMVNLHGTIYYYDDYHGMRNGTLISTTGERHLISNIINEYDNEGIDLYNIGVFAGLDGDYYTFFKNDIEQRLLIYRINDNTFTSEYVEEILINSHPYQVEFIANHQKEVHYLSTGEETIEFDIKTMQMKLLNLKLPKTSKYSFISSKNNLYIKTDWLDKRINTVTQIDLKTLETKYIDFSKNGYKVYNMSSNKKLSNIAFSGARISNDKSIIGEIEESGNITIKEVTNYSNNLTSIIKLN